MADMEAMSPSQMALWTAGFTSMVLGGLVWGTLSVGALSEVVPMR